MLIFGTDIDRINEVKNFLASNFSMKDLGEADMILGIKIIRSQHGIVLTQSSYIEKILRRFQECFSFLFFVIVVKDDAVNEVLEI
ncbi:hypothetical protein RJ639_003849 [Escallonia herrerae]|uniref:Reverse transcriptase Ty1/copia-type domain-containing protein n=1 Tax=Escallonia herrerae TaxID=1293975 RepID=A0AA88W324_9ASTE|nr:hypothetical protein RJ639_003849 [Escallonia herrerae]